MWNAPVRPGASDNRLFFLYFLDALFFTLGLALIRFQPWIWGELIASVIVNTPMFFLFLIIFRYAGMDLLAQRGYAAEQTFLSQMNCVMYRSMRTGAFIGVIMGLIYYVFGNLFG